MNRLISLKNADQHRLLFWLLEGKTKENHVKGALRSSGGVAACIYLDRAYTCALMGARRIERAEGADTREAALWIKGRVGEDVVSTRP